MTKKDYIVFADFFRGQLEIAKNANDLVVDNEKEKAGLLLNFIEATVKDFATVLQNDNANFDRFRFYKACGLDQYAHYINSY